MTGASVLAGLLSIIQCHADVPHRLHLAKPAFVSARGGSSGHEEEYGRLSDDLFRLTPDQIETFHKEGCVTIENVLTEQEVEELQAIFDRFTSGDIKVPGKDFCDMSKPFGTDYKDWSIVNCMLPTRYYPPLQGNIYERLTNSMAQQLFPQAAFGMTKDYDQLLNKRPGKTDAVFAWHQDMAYWPGAAALGVETTDTATFSLAIDDSDEANGCLRYIVGSGVSKKLRPHKPLTGDSREESHALCATMDESNGDIVKLAPAKRGSITIHDEWVVHGSGGNTCPDRQRRTYVVAYRANDIVQAERAIGFTHSHNDDVNWDSFQDGESHRVKKDKP
jgi:Phytanoyl-CoA dioxygenase (PhyH)